MGRGDKRTKRGKITIGSFGKKRPARVAKKDTTAAPVTPAKDAKKSSEA